MWHILLLDIFLFYCQTLTEYFTGKHLSINISLQHLLLHTVMRTFYRHVLCTALHCCSGTSVVLHWVASFTVLTNADISLTCCVQHFTVAVWCSTKSLAGPCTCGNWGPLWWGSRAVKDSLFYVCSWSEHGYVVPSMFGTVCDTEIKANLKVNVLIRTYWLYIWLKASAMRIANNVMADRCPVSYQ